jgi:hypothetical protein
MGIRLGSSQGSCGGDDDAQGLGAVMHSRVPGERVKGGGAEGKRAGEGGGERAPVGTGEGGAAGKGEAGVVAMDVDEGGA